jgi:hypothetical protein
MHHDRLATCDNEPRTAFSEEQLDALVELADAIGELTDRFNQVQQKLDFYESSLLRMAPEMVQIHQHPHLNTLYRWQEFIERITQELDTLTPPV